VEVCRNDLQIIEQEMNDRGEFLETIPHSISLNFRHFTA
jgi:hypothetical protein